MLFVLIPSGFQVGIGRRFYRKGDWVVCGLAGLLLTDVTIAGIMLTGAALNNIHSLVRVLCHFDLQVAVQCFHASIRPAVVLAELWGPAGLHR